MDEPTRPAKHFLTYSDRLSVIVTPKKAKPVKSKSLKKITRKNGVVILKNFLDLPLDVVYEIFGYLEPTDLLTLSRLTKDFRALFMSRTSISIWRRVLSDVKGLPRCPEDMTEPQYTSLMFDKFCMACGSTRGSIVTEYNTRLRLCATCTKTNVCRGYTASTGHGSIFKIASSMIPHYAPASGSYSQLYSNGYYEPTQYYFTPELYATLQEINTRIRRSEQCDFLTFLDQQTQVARRMMDEGAALQSYSTHIRKTQQDINAEITQRRYVRIQEEMEKLGWEERYFPGAEGMDWNTSLVTGLGGARLERDYEKWVEMVYQAKEFSYRNWNSIRPELTEIYTRYRRLHKQTILIRLLSSTYIKHRATLGETKRRKLPPWKDLEKVAAMKEFVSEMWDWDWERCGGPSADTDTGEDSRDGVDVDVEAGVGSDEPEAGGAGTSASASASASDIGDDTVIRFTCTTCPTHLLHEIISTICGCMVKEGMWEMQMARELAEVVNVDEEVRVFGWGLRSKAMVEAEGKGKGEEKKEGADSAATTATSATNTTSGLSEKTKGKQKAVSAPALQNKVQGGREGVGAASTSTPTDVLSLARNLFMCHCSLCSNPESSTSTSASTTSASASRSHCNRSIGRDRVVCPTHT